jgi:hypothetical protein
MSNYSFGKVLLILLSTCLTIFAGVRLWSAQQEINTLTTYSAEIESFLMETDILIREAQDLRHSLYADNEHIQEPTSDIITKLHKVFNQAESSALVDLSEVSLTGLEKIAQTYQEELYQITKTEAPNPHNDVATFSIRTVSELIESIRYVQKEVLAVLSNKSPRLSVRLYSRYHIQMLSELRALEYMVIIKNFARETQISEYDQDIIRSKYEDYFIEWLELIDLKSLPSDYSMQLLAYKTQMDNFMERTYLNIEALNKTGINKTNAEKKVLVSTRPGGVGTVLQEYAYHSFVVQDAIFEQNRKLIKPIIAAMKPYKEARRNFIFLFLIFFGLTIFVFRQF